MKALDTNAADDFDDTPAARPQVPAASGTRQPLRIIWNRRWLVLFAMAVGVMTALGIYLAATPVYVASAQLALHDSSPLSYNNSAAQAGLKDRVTSPDVLALGLSDAALENFKKPGNSIGRLQKGLKVDLDRAGEVMTISLEGPSPSEVSLIVNDVAKALQTTLNEKNKNATDEVLATIAQRKQKYEDELASRTREKIDFQRQAGGIAMDLDRSGVVATRLNELKQSIMSKHNDVLSDKAAYESAIRLSGLSDDQVKIILDKQQFNNRPVLLTSDDTQLRDQLYLAQQKLAELQQRYLERHPAIIQARETVDYLQASYVSALYQRWLSARRQEDGMQKRYDEQRKTAVELSVKAVQFAQLDAELKSTQRSLDMLEAQMQAAPPPVEPHAIEVTLIDPAQTPTSPVRPLAWSYLLQGLLIGLIVGIGSTFIDGRMRSLAEARQGTGLAVLGVVPRMPASLTPATRGRKFQLDPTGDVADACRSIRSAIYLGGRGKTILIASPSRGEGKSTVASNLAIALAEGGQKVLLIDADMREPVQHRIFATAAETGISSVVAGRASIQRAAQSTAAKGLDLLGCGPVPFNPAETINNQAFADMLAQINARYDYVVLDSPPVNAVTDARILAAMCDMTVLVVRKGCTTRRAAADARDGLRGFGANLLGVVVNGGARQASYATDLSSLRRPANISNPARAGERLPAAAQALLAAPRRRS